MKNNSIGNLQDMMQVATNCSGYQSNGPSSSFTNCVGDANCKSCTNCKNLKSNKCDANLYDSTLAGLDRL